jgi:acyl carrier protein
MNRTEMIDVIESIVCDVMEFERDKIRPNHSFEEMELDSLAVVEVVEGIEERLGVTIDDEDLNPKTGIANMHDLYDYVWERLPNKEG